MRKGYILLLLAGLAIPAMAFSDTTTIASKVHPLHKTQKTKKIRTTQKLPVISKPHYKGEPSVSTRAVRSASVFKATGYLDGSYNMETRNKFTSGSYDRVFDRVPNGLTLQQAATTLAYQPSQGLGGLMNLIAGSDANITASYGFPPVSEFDSQTIAVDVTQLYLQYAMGPVTLMGGRFLTLVGVEQIDPTQNANFSRGNLFYNTPDTHTGVRVIYAVNDKINLTAGVNDGWDNIRDWGRRKTIELGFGYIVNPVFSFSIQGYNGGERVVPQTSYGPTGIRTLIDVVATLNATDKLTLVLNYDNGWQTLATLPTGVNARAGWAGLAGYVNYKLNDTWRSSLRAEVFDDKNGFRTGVRQNWRELTVTIGYSPVKNLELRGEARHDFSNVNSFVSSTGVGVNNGQQSYALEGVYKIG